MPPDFQGQTSLTDACSVPRANLSKTVVGMAHFAGTGPFGTTCKECAHWQLLQGKKKPICAKYKSMTGDSTKPVGGRTMSCRYFQGGAT